MLTFLFATAAASFVAQDVHDHGNAVLSLTTDGTTLIAEFTTDQHTLYGTDHDHDHHDEVEAKLLAGDALFTLDVSTSCTRSDAGVEAASKDGLLGDKHDHDHDEHHHDHGDHDHDHDDHHDDHQGHDEHVDITIRQTFTCEASPSIDSVTVAAFDVIPALEKVDVVVLTNNQQVEKTANRRSRKVSL